MIIDVDTDTEVQYLFYIGDKKKLYLKFIQSSVVQMLSIVKQYYASSKSAFTINVN